MVGGQGVLDLEPFGGETIPGRRGKAIEFGTVPGWGRVDRSQGDRGRGAAGRAEDGSQVEAGVSWDKGSFRRRCRLSIRNPKDEGALIRYIPYNPQKAGRSLKAWASLFQDSSPVPSKARPKVSHPRWAEAPSGQRDRVSASLQSTSPQADHMTKVPGSIRQPALTARGSTVWNRLRGRTAELPRFRPGEWPRTLKPSPEGEGFDPPSMRQ